MGARAAPPGLHPSRRPARAGRLEDEEVRVPQSGIVRTTDEVGWSLSVGSFTFFTIMSS